jgi:hypothetical protein
LVAALLLCSLLPGPVGSIFAAPTGASAQFADWVRARLGSVDDENVRLSLDEAALGTHATLESFVDDFVSAISNRGSEALVRSLLRSDDEAGRSLADLILAGRSSLSPSPWTAVVRLERGDYTAVGTQRPSSSASSIVDPPHYGAAEPKSVVDASESGSELQADSGWLSSRQPNGP